MANQQAVDQIAKSISFEVEAIPQDNTIQLTSTANTTPLNVKIKVRKKQDAAGATQNAVISVPKLGKPGAAPQRVRLVSSDQTIMSFNVFMENEDDNKAPRKAKKGLFGFLKAGTRSDDEGSRSKSPTPKNQDSANRSADEMYNDTSMQSQNISNNSSSFNQKSNKKGILGKCKLGGCLDPPFGEDRYAYEKKKRASPVQSTPVIELYDQDLKVVGQKPSIMYKTKGLDKKGKTSLDGVTVEKKELKNATDSPSHPSMAQDEHYKITEIFSDPLITYPPAVTVSEQEMHDKVNEKNLKNRISTTENNNYRTSVQSSAEIYYCPSDRKSSTRSYVEKHKQDTIVTATPVFKSSSTEVDKLLKVKTTTNLETSHANTPSSSTKIMLEGQPLFPYSPNQLNDYFQSDVEEPVTKDITPPLSDSKKHLRRAEAELKNDNNEYKVADKNAPLKDNIENDTKQNIETKNDTMTSKRSANVVHDYANSMKLTMESQSARKISMNQSTNSCFDVDDYYSISNKTSNEKALFSEGMPSKVTIKSKYDVTGETKSEEVHQNERVSSKHPSNNKPTYVNYSKPMPTEINENLSDANLLVSRNISSNIELNNSNDINLMPIKQTVEIIPKNVSLTKSTKGKSYLTGENSGTAITDHIVELTTTREVLSKTSMKSHVEYADGVVAKMNLTEQDLTKSSSDTLINSSKALANISNGGKNEKTNKFLEKKERLSTTANSSQKFCQLGFGYANDLEKPENEQSEDYGREVASETADQPQIMYIDDNTTTIQKEISTKTITPQGDSWKTSAIIHSVYDNDSDHFLVPNELTTQHNVPWEVLIRSSSKSINYSKNDRILTNEVILTQSTAQIQSSYDNDDDHSIQMEQITTDPEDTNFASKTMDNYQLAHDHEKSINSQTIEETSTHAKVISKISAEYKEIYDCESDSVSNELTTNSYSTKESTRSSKSKLGILDAEIKSKYLSSSEASARSQLSYDKKTRVARNKQTDKTYETRENTSNTDTDKEKTNKQAIERTQVYKEASSKKTECFNDLDSDSFLYNLTKSCSSKEVSTFVIQPSFALDSEIITNKMKPKTFMTGELITKASKKNQSIYACDPKLTEKEETGEVDAPKTATECLSYKTAAEYERKYFMNGGEIANQKDIVVKTIAPKVVSSKVSEKSKSGFDDNYEKESVSKKQTQKLYSSKQALIPPPLSKEILSQSSVKDKKEPVANVREQKQHKYPNSSFETIRNENVEKSFTAKEITSRESTKTQPLSEKTEISSVLFTKLNYENDSKLTEKTSAIKVVISNSSVKSHSTFIGEYNNDSNSNDPNTNYSTRDVSRIFLSKSLPSCAYESRKLTEEMSVKPLKSPSASSIVLTKSRSIYANGDDTIHDDDVKIVSENKEVAQDGSIKASEKTESRYYGDGVIKFSTEIDSNKEIISKTSDKNRPPHVTESVQIEITPKLIQKLMTTNIDTEKDMYTSASKTKSIDVDVNDFHSGGSSKPCDGDSTFIPGLQANKSPTNKLVLPSSKSSDFYDKNTLSTENITKSKISNANDENVAPDEEIIKMSAFDVTLQYDPCIVMSKITEKRGESHTENDELFNKKNITKNVHQTENISLEDFEIFSNKSVPEISATSKLNQGKDSNFPANQVTTESLTPARASLEASMTSRLSYNELALKIKQSIEKSPREVCSNTEISRASDMLCRNSISIDSTTHTASIKQDLKKIQSSNDNLNIPITTVLPSLRQNNDKNDSVPIDLTIQSTSKDVLSTIVTDNNSISFEISATGTSLKTLPKSQEKISENALSSRNLSTKTKVASNGSMKGANQAPSKSSVAKRFSARESFQNKLISLISSKTSTKSKLNDKDDLKFISETLAMKTSCTKKELLKTIANISTSHSAASESKTNESDAKTLLSRELFSFDLSIERTLEGKNEVMRTPSLNLLDTSGDEDIETQQYLDLKIDIEGSEQYETNIEITENIKSNEESISNLLSQIILVEPSKKVKGTADIEPSIPNTLILAEKQSNDDKIVPKETQNATLITPSNDHNQINSIDEVDKENLNVLQPNIHTTINDFTQSNVALETLARLSLDGFEKQRNELNNMIKEVDTANNTTNKEQQKSNEIINHVSHKDFTQSQSEVKSETGTLIARNYATSFEPHLLELTYGESRQSFKPAIELSSNHSRRQSDNDDVKTRVSEMLMLDIYNENTKNSAHNTEDIHKSEFSFHNNNFDNLSFESEESRNIKVVDDVFKTFEKTEQTSRSYTYLGANQIEAFENINGNSSQAYNGTQDIKLKSKLGMTINDTEHIKKSPLPLKPIYSQDSFQIKTIPYQGKDDEASAIQENLRIKGILVENSTNLQEYIKDIRYEQNGHDLIESMNIKQQNNSTTMRPFSFNNYNRVTLEPNDATSSSDTQLDKLDVKLSDKNFKTPPTEKTLDMSEDEKPRTAKNDLKEFSRSEIAFQSINGFNQYTKPSDTIHQTEDHLTHESEALVVDFAFQSYLNNRNEKVLKSFDSNNIPPKRYKNDNITTFRSILQSSDEPISIAIDSSTNVFMEIDKRDLLLRGSREEDANLQNQVFQACDEVHTAKSSPVSVNTDENLQKVLSTVYHNHMVPLQDIIKHLKEDIDSLATQQEIFRQKILMSKKTKSIRISPTVKRCGCLRKY